MTIGLPIGTRMSLQRYGGSRPLRTRDNGTLFFGELDVSEELDVTDCHFKKVQGLSDRNCISFESIKRPGHFLRHRGPDTRVEVSSGFLDPWFAADATFRPRPGTRTPSWAKALEFEAVNHSDCFLRRNRGHVILSRWDSAQSYGFEELRPITLGQSVDVGGWTVLGTAPGIAFVERTTTCTGLTPLLGTPRRLTASATLSTGRIVRSVAVSTVIVGFRAYVRLEGSPDFLNDVYSIKTFRRPCIWSL